MAPEVADIDRLRKTPVTLGVVLVVCAALLGAVVYLLNGVRGDLRDFKQDMRAASDRLEQRLESHTERAGAAIKEASNTLGTRIDRVESALGDSNRKLDRLLEAALSDPNRR